MTSRQLCALMQMEEILVHIIPPTKDSPANFSREDISETKTLARHLKRTFGSGALWDPKGAPVIPDPKRELIAGEYRFTLCPQGKLKTPHAPARQQKLCWSDRVCMSYVGVYKGIHHDSGKSMTGARSSNRIDAEQLLQVEVKGLYQGSHFVDA